MRRIYGKEQTHIKDPEEIKRPRKRVTRRRAPASIREASMPFGLLIIQLCVAAIRASLTA